MPYGAVHVPLLPWIPQQSWGGDDCVPMPFMLDIFYSIFDPKKELQNKYTNEDFSYLLDIVRCTYIILQ
jgi:hypothetical protein